MYVHRWFVDGDVERTTVFFVAGYLDVLKIREFMEYLRSNASKSICGWFIARMWMGERLSSLSPVTSTSYEFKEIKNIIFEINLMRGGDFSGAGGRGEFRDHVHLPFCFVTFPFCF